MKTKTERKRKRRAGRNTKNGQQHGKEPSAPASHGLQQDTRDEPILSKRDRAGAASPPSSQEAAGSSGEGSSIAGTSDEVRKKSKKRQRQGGDASSTTSVVTAMAGLQHPSPPPPLVASDASSAKVTATVEGSPQGQHKMNKKKRKKKKRRGEKSPSAVQEDANAVTDGDDTTAVLPNQQPPCGKTKKPKPNSVTQTGPSSAVSSGGTTNTKQPGGKVPGRHPYGTNAANESRGAKAIASGEKAAVGGSKLSALQQRMRQKLEGAQFRMINETLYTSESKVALDKFSKEPELFDVYHRGFREQVEKWPVHPLDLIIDWLGKYPKARVADFGCGEARLAATVPNKVYSFDLVSPNPRVTACDMAHVPIKDRSVHVTVFCLSLMGTNLADFLREAHRVLVPGGLVKVAEVRSRFEGEEGGVERFLEVAKRLGFDSRQVDRSNTMFLMAEFKKSGREPEDGVEFEAKACVYKRR